MKPTSVFSKIIIAIIFLPFILLVYFSIIPIWPYPEVIPDHWAFDNWYHFLYRDQSVLHGLMLSIIVGVSVSTTATVLGFLTSHQLSRSKHSDRLLTFAYFPYVLSPVILAVIINYFFVQFSWNGTVLGILFAQLLITFPYAFILFFENWDPKTRDYEQLVYTLGGNYWQALIRVLAPKNRAIIQLVWAQCFLISWFEYGLTQFIGLGKVQTLTIQVFKFINEANTAHAAFASILLVFPLIIILFIFRNIRFRIPLS